MSDPRCGTYAGVQRHNRLAEIHCDDCLVAFANYQSMRRRRLALGLNLIDPDQGDPRPWHVRPELADLAHVGPVLDAAWRWSA